MGRRDFRQHETKKPKKGAQKAPIATVLTPPPPVVEVIKKPRKVETEESET